MAFGKSNDNRRAEEKLLQTPDVFKTLPHDELVHRAEAVSKYLLKKNKKAYEDLANK